MGARAYTIINNIDFKPDEVVVEIGSERGEGSTGYLATFCKARYINFYSVDADKTVYDTVKGLNDLNFTAFCMTGEDFLTTTFPGFNKQVKFVYLDNFDWIWKGDEKRRYIRNAVARYRERGVDMNNIASQQAHLQQSVLIANYVVKDGVILFDDTWQPSKGVFNGKGGTAVPWLLNHGFVIYKKSEDTEDIHKGFVSVIKKQIMNSADNQTANSLDELSKLALKYGADKWSDKYHYTPVYHELFGDKQKSVKKIIEIGIGEKAASLKMWQDFFPNAKIYGVDYRSDLLIKQDRIESFLCDQRRKKHLINLIGKTDSDIDLIIDDGSHRPRDQVFTCKTLMPLLKKNAIYIIEDVADPSIIEQFSLYESKMVTVGKRNDDRLIIVRNKTKTDTYEYILKKYNIDPVRQSFIEIPNVGRNNLAELFAELKFTKGAEIGVSVGHYSEILCKANPKLHLYSIDPWEISAYGPDVIPSEIGIAPNQEAFKADCEVAKKRLAAYNCTIVQKHSLVAAQDFADNSFDFVYIDANHDFVNATNDIDTWKKKVKLGGILAGHEYENFPPKKWNHVKSMLQGYMPSYQMLPCFILGTKHGKENGEIRDRIRSWFWVKKGTNK